MIFLLSLIFLTSHETTRTTKIYVSCYSVLASVLLSVVFLSSTYFVGEKTTNRNLFEANLREIENTIIELDGIDLDVVINPEEVVEEMTDGQN